jgi:hypothetical protein
MTDAWTVRADLYRESEAHRRGADLDLLVEWSAGARTALDVATGGGHVTRRLQEAGLEVVTCDPAPGMRADVICGAEDMPFSDDRVLVADNLYVDESGEEADRLRDPTHVRNYAEDEWRSFFEAAGLRVEAAERCDHEVELDAWLERTGCVGDAAERVRALLADRISDGWLALPRIALKGRR